VTYNIRTCKRLHKQGFYEALKLATLLKNLIHQHLLTRQRLGDLSYMSSQLAAPVIGFVTSIIAAKYLLPYELGVIQTVMLVATYSSYLHFGVFNGLNRNIAFYEAKNDTQKIQDMVAASRLTAIVNAAIGLLITVIVLIYFLMKGYPSLYIYSTAIILGTLTFSPLSTHYETIYRSSRAFMSLGIFLHIRNTINFLLGLLPIFFGALGHIFRNAVLPIASVLLLYRNSPIKPESTGEFSEVLDLASVGFPMLVTGALFMFFTVADRTIVALTLGPTAVGELALSGMIVAAISVLPVSIGALLYPRASYIYGLSKTSSGLRRFFFSAWPLTSSQSSPSV